MNWAIEKYKKLPSREQKQIKLLAIMVTLSAYLFWAAMTWQEMFETEKLANRKANRIETRVGDLETPTLENGVSEKVLNQLTESIEQQEAQLRFLLSDLLPLDTPGPREQLKLEIARLVTDNQLRLVRLNSTNDELRAPIEGMRGEALRRSIESRPTFHLRLEGRFLNLIYFIDSLNKLSYSTYVTNISAERHDEYFNELKIQVELRI